MSEFTALYGAIDKLFKQSLSDNELRSVIDSLSALPDELTITRTICSADGDWMDAIERGLAFVGKALDEERRFIRTSGEVRPIEKIKRVTKESVRHLARHSELINKDMSDDEIVPDKLYNVERLNDYATYENRFLYTLLLMTKEFISRKISELSACGTYKGEYRADKVVTSGKRCIRLRVDVSEERSGEDPTFNALSERLSTMLNTVGFYLQSPIMMEVAKSEGAIRTAVTLTNILKMDPNFKGAFSLYEYLASFSGEGFKVTSDQRTIAPSDRMNRDLTTPCLMYLMLLREYASGDPASRWYDFVEKENSDRKSALRDRIAAGGGEEKYIVSLENRLSERQGDRAVFEDECRRLKEAHAAEIEALRARHSEDIARQKSEWRQKADEAAEEFARVESELRSSLSDSGSRIDELLGTLDELRSQNVLLSARVNALSSRLGISDPFDEQGFAELELEYEALGRLVRKEWQGVKKMMRRQMWSDIKASISSKGGSETEIKGGTEFANDRDTNNEGGDGKDE